MRTDSHRLVGRPEDSPDAVGWLYNVAGWDAVVITFRNGENSR
jgi:hypothetical protein